MVVNKQHAYMAQVVNPSATIQNLTLICHSALHSFNFYKVCLQTYVVVADQVIPSDKVISANTLHQESII